MRRAAGLALALALTSGSAAGARVGAARGHPRTALPRMSSPAAADALGAAAREMLVRASDVARVSTASLERAQELVREAQQQLDAPAASPSRWSALRRGALARMLALDRSAYLVAVGELGGKLPRAELPNRQDVPIAPGAPPQAPVLADGTLGGCSLANVTYAESALDVLLLRIFRAFVRDETGYASDKPAMAGLAQEGRAYMLRASEAEQQQMVVNVLARLFTPAGPPFYRVFMSGVWGQRRLGPWPWAPALTSWVTPLFFKFLVGPSTPNYRADGQLGGLVVEKCRFLQESGCKGLCVHQCKLPAQRFFADDLGLPLAVYPNFETQECQWSFGEVPLPVEQDPSLPAGCLSGCPSRKALTEAKACNRCS